MPPPELAGRDELRELVRVAIVKSKAGTPTEKHLNGRAPRRGQNSVARPHA